MSEHGEWLGLCPDCGYTLNEAFCSRCGFEADLKAHLGSWEYANAMAVTCQSLKDYPVFIEARVKADELRERVSMQRTNRNGERWYG